ncbi:MAG: NAD(P)/FAD-dependent oxidoreductase [Armatimonadetes bacterium]|nr:NAD(P)/FAD-dependent oxidoreductase [Armatimonadota bacterium]
MVLGAGFAGVAFMDALWEALGPQPRIDLRLIDRNNFKLFTPLLYQVATGLVSPDNISYPVRRRTRRRGARFQESLVQGIDLEARRVLTDDGPVPYDTLVVALGSVTNFFGMQDVARHALTLKTLGDGITVRNRLIDAFEEADVTTDPERRRALLTFNIVGAGATGVELATAIDNLINLVLLRDYPGINAEEVRIRLIEALDRAVPEMSEGVCRFTAKRLAERHIELRLGDPVVGLEGDRLRTRSGNLLPPGTTIWTAGVRANPVARGLPVEHGQGGRVVVTDTLQLPGHPEVFCVGDNALITDPATGRPVPPNAPAAIQMAQATARNVARRLRGEPLQPFRYHFKGELLSLGRNHAVLHLGGLLLDGFPAWVVWRAFYLTELMGMENRVGVMADWAFAYLSRLRESGRLICEPALAEEEGVMPTLAGRMR